MRIVCIGMVCCASVTQNSNFELYYADVWPAVGVAHQSATGNQSYGLFDIFFFIQLICTVVYLLVHNAHIDGTILMGDDGLNTFRAIYVSNII